MSAPVVTASTPAPPVPSHSQLTPGAAVLPAHDPKADKKRKKERGRRLWAKIEQSMKKLNDELGYPAGAVMVKDGRIQSCGTLGAAASAAQRLSLAQSVRSEVFERSREAATSNTYGFAAPAGQETQATGAQGPRHAVYLTPLPRPIENLTETELRSWVPKYVKESTGRNQPRWGDENFKPSWWPTVALPFENVNRDHRLVKGSSYADALRHCIRACLDYHNIPVEQAVQTTYMESGKAHRKLTVCASNVCKGTAPLALVASRETTSPEDSENLTRAATLLSEQVTILLQIAQGLSAADVLTSLSRPVMNPSVSEEDPVAVPLVQLSTAPITTTPGSVVIDEGPFPLVGTSIVEGSLPVEEVMVDSGTGFTLVPAVSTGSSGVSLTTTPHSIPSSLVAAAAAAAEAVASTAVEPSTTVTFVGADELDLHEQQHLQLHDDQLQSLRQHHHQQQQQQQHTVHQLQQQHAAAAAAAAQKDHPGIMIPVSVLPNATQIQHVEESIVGVSTSLHQQHQQAHALQQSQQLHQAQQLRQQQLQQQQLSQQQQRLPPQLQQ